MRRYRALAVVLVGLASGAPAATQVHYVMGTFLRVDVDGSAAPAAFDACFAEARALDRTFSRFDPTSELVGLNAAGGGTASRRLRETLGRARALSETTGGTFDVSAGALTALWRAPLPPTPDALAAARRSVGRVVVTRDRVTLGAGTQLDFDGFAKGVAVDACATALGRAGVTRALVSFGESSIRALGAPRGQRAWRLDLRGPDPDVAVAELALRNESASVSSAFGGAGRSPGRRCGRIVDPRSGACLDEDAASVVIAGSAAVAEAWSKAVLVGGAGGVTAADAAGVRAARITRTGLAMGDAMRGSGRLRPFATPRRLGGEVALR